MLFSFPSPLLPPMCFERGKIITAVVAWVKRQLNAVAVSTDLKLMFAEEEGYGYELITETTTTTKKKNCWTAEWKIHMIMLKLLLNYTQTPSY